jgi:hypothetical protein
MSKRSSLHRSRDTFHRTDLTALENPSFSNEKADWMDAEREQGEAMRDLWLRIGFLTSLATSGRAPAIDGLPFGFVRAALGLGGPGEGGDLLNVIDGSWVTHSLWRAVGSAVPGAGAHRFHPSPRFSSEGRWNRAAGFCIGKP